MHPCRGHAILHDSYTLLHVMLCILATGGHVILHDSYTLLHVMRCILAGAMLFFTIATPFYMSCDASLQGPCYSSR